MTRLNGLSFSARWLLVIAIISSGKSYALDPDRAITQYVHRIWESDQGLPGVRGLAQSRDGYLLVGGQAGLMRFDGVRFSSIDGNWVRSILEDGDDRLWVATNDSGVLRFDQGASTHFTKANGLPSDHVTCLVSGHNGDIWACTPDGLVQFSQDKVHVYGNRQGLRVKGLVSACSAPDGTLWLGGEGPSITSWNGSAFRSIALSSVPANSSVRAVLCSSDGALWVGSSEGLIRLKDSRQQRWTTKDGLVDNRINALMQSSDGTLWIGTQDGLSRLRNGRLENYRSDDGLSQSNIYAVFEDREGSIWISTKHGLDQFLDGPAVLYTAKDGLPGNSAGPVLVDRNNQLWIGTFGGGLSHFDGRRFSRVTQGDGLVSNTVRSLARDAAGNLWVGTNRGVNRLRERKVVETFTMRNGLPSDRVHSLFRDHSGTIWAGTDAGLAKLVKGRFVQPPVLPKALSVRIAAMGEDLAGNLLFSIGQGGVYSLAKGKVDEVLYHGAPILDADTFYTDSDGLVWIGTIGNGLLLLDHGKIFKFSMRDGLYDKKIFGIAGDSQDRLWFTCIKGLYSVKRSDLRRFAAGEIKTLVSTPYTPMDSTNTIECRSGSQPSILRTYDGRLWFSSNRGLVVFDPNSHKRDSSPPPVAIEQIVVNGEVRDAKNIAKLPPGEKNVQFRYTGINFTMPARVTFRYKLEGYDKDWIDAGTRREAYYTKLPPGNFRFRVTACTADAACNESGSAVDFGLAYWYYERGWFLPVCLSLAGSMIWLFHRLRVRQLRERFSLVLAERNRIARELHDTLIHGLSGLTMQVQALTDRTRSPGYKVALEEIIRDAAACMRETRESVIGLRCTPASGSGLAPAIESAAKQIAKDTNVLLKLELDEKSRSLPADVEYNLLCIAREAISNSIQHAGARTIEVTLAWTDEQLRLKVRDDGRGFDPERGGIRPVGHYGLTGMRERANLIGADFNLESWPGGGTAISVFRPSFPDNQKSSHRVKEGATR